MNNFLDSIFGYFKKTRREDEAFGPMLYMGDRLKYWEGKARLPWANSEIEVFVDGLAQDNMEQQHEFFRQVSHEWPKLREEIEQLLQQAWPQRNAKVKAASVGEQFVVSSMTIPKGDLDSAEWEVSFTAPSDSHLYTVQMKGRKPLQVAIG